MAVRFKLKNGLSHRQRNSTTLVKTLQRAEKRQSRKSRAALEVHHQQGEVEIILLEASAVQPNKINHP